MLSQQQMMMLMLLLVFAFMMQQRQLHAQQGMLQGMIGFIKRAFGGNAQEMQSKLSSEAKAVVSQCIAMGVMTSDLSPSQIQKCIIDKAKEKGKAVHDEVKQNIRGIVDDLMSKYL